MLKLDIVGVLPTELALHIFSFVSVATLLQATLVNHHWHTLTETQVVWKSLCAGRGWRGKYTPSPLDQRMNWQAETKSSASELLSSSHHSSIIDEGFNDGDMETPTADTFASTSTTTATGLGPAHSTSRFPTSSRHSAPVSSSLPFLHPGRPLRRSVDYKLLFRTRTILDRRLRNGQYELTVVNAPSMRASLPANFSFNPNEPGSSGAEDEQIFGHTSTIYAICLANDIVTGDRTIFTASRDQTILQWQIPPSSAFSTSGNSDMDTRRRRRSTTSSLPLRVFQGAHHGSVLSICVAPEFGYLMSGGSDGRIVVWDMQGALPLRTLAEPIAHEDSVLCVRCDDRRLVSCSKGMYHIHFAQIIYILAI